MHGVGGEHKALVGDGVDFSIEGEGFPVENKITLECLETRGPKLHRENKKMELTCPMEVAGRAYPR